MKKIFIIFNCLILICWVGLQTANAQVTLNLNLFTEGSYVGSGQMNPCMFNEAVAGATPLQVDTMRVELHDALVPATVVSTAKGILLTNGTMSCTFPGTVSGKSLYIAIRHRSTIETWSAAPILFTTITNYDFSSAQCQAYGCNMVKVASGPNIWAFYTGDINQDGNIDLFDFITLDYAMNNGLFGYYSTDLNCDGNVDLLDFPMNDANIQLGIYTHHP